MKWEITTLSFIYDPYQQGHLPSEVVLQACLKILIYYKWFINFYITKQLVRISFQARRLTYSGRLQLVLITRLTKLDTKTYKLWSKDTDTVQDLKEICQFSKN